MCLDETITCIIACKPISHKGAGNYRCREFVSHTSHQCVQVVGWHMNCDFINISSGLNLIIQRLYTESARLSEGIVVHTSEKEYHFSMFTRWKETFELMVQLSKISIKE